MRISIGGGKQNQANQLWDDLITTGDLEEQLWQWLWSHDTIKLTVAYQLNHLVLYDGVHKADAVSYTHLTLPTNREV